MVDADVLINYVLKWDLSQFFHIALKSIGPVGGVYFCALLGVKLGWGVLRDALNI